MLQFVQRMVRLRRQHPIFRRRSFFRGEALPGAGIKDITWLTPGGAEMSDEDWKQEYARCLGVYLAGDAIAQTDLYGRPVSDSRFLVLFNAHHEDIVFRLPEVATAIRWMMLMDTTHEDGLARGGVFDAGSEYLLHSRSVALLQEQKAAR
jgi:isoamylase